MNKSLNTYLIWKEGKVFEYARGEYPLGVEVQHHGLLGLPGIRLTYFDGRAARYRGSFQDSGEVVGIWFGPLKQRKLPPEFLLALCVLGISL